MFSPVKNHCLRCRNKPVHVCSELDTERTFYIQFFLLAVNNLPLFTNLYNPTKYSLILFLGTRHY